MIHSTARYPDPTQPAEFVVEPGRTGTCSTTLAAGASSARATLDITATETGDAAQSTPEAGPGSRARGSFAAAAVVGLGGVAIILVWHFCARDHDFIAALIGVAFCLAGWGLASRSFPHTTREYSTSSRSGEEKP
jgi:hypothetical protein